MTTKQALLQARELIKAKQYDDARQLLEPLDHPTAQQWLAKLDALVSKPADQPSASGMGQIIAEFGINNSQLIRRLVFGLMTVPMFLVVMTIFPRQLSLNAETIISAVIPFLILGGGMMLTAPALMAWMGKRQTTIYTNGVERTDLSGKHFITWGELEAVKGGLTNYRTAGIVMYTTGAYDFYADGKVAFQVTSIDGKYPELYAQLCKQITNTHTPKLLKRWQRGETLKFEQMEVCPDGLHIGRHFLPREEIGDVWINGRMTGINRRNGKVWQRFMMEAAYNPWVFQAVVNSIARQ